MLEYRKMKSSYTVGGTINWYSYGEKQYGSSLKKKENLKIEPPYDLAIPFWVHILRKL